MNDRENVEWWEKHFDKRYDAKYVSKADFHKVKEEVEKRFSNDDKRISLLIFQQKINNWLTAAIAGGIVALVIKVFLGG